MSNNQTETYMQKFRRLEQIKSQLTTQQPDLDQLVPLYEETSEIEDTLTKFFKDTRRVIEEKRKQRNVIEE